MKAVSNFFDWLFTEFSKADFALLAVIDFAAFAAVFITVLICCICSRKIRAAEKKPFFHVVNLFSAVTLIIFMSRYSFTRAAAITCAFWLVGYLLYGALCLFGKKNEKKPAPAAGGQPVSTVRQPKPPQTPAPSAPYSAGEVRLEHALSIADKLLLKNIGRGDRQELEKIKTALTVLKVKGSLSPQEGEALNDMFNALLKLMARYDL